MQQVDIDVAAQRVTVTGPAAAETLEAAIKKTGKPTSLVARTAA